jgi:hypothetical protein
MNTGNLRFWHSSIVCWALFAFFAVLTLIWQDPLGDVRQYPNKKRDDLVGTMAFGGLATGFFILARKAKKSN